MTAKNKAPWWKSGHNLLMAGCVLVMGYVLLSSDQASGWSSLLLLACPLMHLLMMRGMGGQSCHGKDKETVTVEPVKKPTELNKEF